MYDISEVLMDLTNFSLIYPDEKALKAHYSGEDRSYIPMFELEELGLTDVLELRGGQLSDFFTTDKSVMEYRMEVFEDMLSNEDISKTLNINQTTVSHQLRLLRDNGVVKYKRQGKIVFYSLKNDLINEVLLKGVEFLGY